VQDFKTFVRDTLRTSRGLPDPEIAVPDRVRSLDDRMATTDVLAWSVVTGAAVIGAASFGRLLRASPATPAATLVARSTICTWSLVAIALAKLWHAQAQDQTMVMKELLLLRDRAA
jgi:hypothetical protein